MAEALNMNLLWNSFVSIGESLRGKYRQLLFNDPEVASLQVEYDSADAAVQAAYKEFKKAKSRSRSQEGEVNLFQDELDRLKKERQEIALSLKEVKSRVKESRRDELKTTANSFFEKIDEEWKKAYRGSVYWGNANAVKDSYCKAWQKGFKTGNFPKFHRFTGEARFCYQFMGGLPTEKLIGWKSKFISIAPYDTSCDCDKPPGLTQRKTHEPGRTTMLFRIGGVPLQFHINLHRELPAGYLKQAVVARTKVGMNIKWRVFFAIEREGPRPVKKCGTALAAIDLGFRMIDDHMRLGVLVAADRREEIWMPDTVLLKRRHSKKLQSFRDSLCNKIKERIFDLLPPDVPTDLTSNWEKARQPRLVKILEHLKGTGHPLVADIQIWYKQDRRLYNEIYGGNARARRQRTAAFYSIAYGLFDKFSTIVLNTLDLVEMSKREKRGGSPDELVGPAREYRTIAALGEFIRILTDVSVKREGKVIKSELVSPSIRCHVCGKICAPRNRLKRVFDCEHCGTEWDKDVHAAMNLYVEYEGKEVQSGV